MQLLAATRSKMLQSFISSFASVACEGCDRLTNFWTVCAYVWRIAFPTTVAVARLSCCVHAISGETHTQRNPSGRLQCLSSWTVVSTWQGERRVAATWRHRSVWCFAHVSNVPERVAVCHTAPHPRVASVYTLSWQPLLAPAVGPLNRPPDRFTRSVSPTFLRRFQN